MQHSNINGRKYCEYILIENKQENEEGFFFTSTKYFSFWFTSNGDWCGKNSWVSSIYGKLNLYRQRGWSQLVCIPNHWKKEQEELHKYDNRSQSNGSREQLRTTINYLFFGLLSNKFVTINLQLSHINLSS